MPNWCVLGDVQDRLSYKTIDATSVPNDTRTIAWLNEAEAFIRTALASSGLPTTFTNPSDPQMLLGKWAVDYGEGRVRCAWAAANGDSSNLDGQNLIQEFSDRIDDINSKPSFYSELLTGAGAPQRGTYLQAYTTRNLDGKSIANGDFLPTITRNETF